jgi:hypothetical protein
MLKIAVRTARSNVKRASRLRHHHAAAMAPSRVNPGGPKTAEHPRRIKG